MAKHTVTLGTADTYNDRNAAAVRPYEDGEAVIDAVLNRPIDLLRIRTENLRTELEDLKYVSDADRAILLTCDGALSVVANDDGTLKLQLPDSATLSLWPMVGPSSSQRGYADLATGQAGVVIRIKATQQLRSYGDVTKSTPGASINDYTCTLNQGVAGSSVAVAPLDGDPARHLIISFPAGMSANALASALTPLLVPYKMTAETVDVDEGGSVSDSVLAIANERRSFQGGYEREVHTVPAGGLNGYFITEPGLADGDTLAVGYVHVSAVTGGRRASNPDLSESDEDVTNNLTNLTKHPEKIPGALPICTRVGNFLVFIDGTRIKVGDSVELGASLTRDGGTIRGELSVTENLVVQGSATVEKSTTLRADTKSDTPLRVEGTSDQTGNLTQWVTGASTVATVSSDGNLKGPGLDTLDATALTLGTATAASVKISRTLKTTEVAGDLSVKEGVEVAPRAKDYVPLNITAPALQETDLTRWTVSSAIKARVDKSGAFWGTGLDRQSVGELSIGTDTATAVKIGRSSGGTGDAVDTTVLGDLGVVGGATVGGALTSGAITAPSVVVKSGTATVVTLSSLGDVIATRDVKATGNVEGSQLVSTVTGDTTPPLTVSSTAKVTNLNADRLDGYDWASPADIGTGTPKTGTFTKLVASGAHELKAATASDVALVVRNNNANSGFIQQWFPEHSSATAVASVDYAGNIKATSLEVTTLNPTTPLALNKGGTGAAITLAKGSLLYGNTTANGLAPLAMPSGSDPHVLTATNGGVPAWTQVNSITSNLNAVTLLNGTWADPKTSIGSATTKYGGTFTNLTADTLAAGTLTLTNALAVGQGGTGLKSFTPKSILYASDSSSLGQLTPAVGTAKHVLTMTNQQLAWEEPAAQSTDAQTLRGDTWFTPTGTGALTPDFTGGTLDTNVTYQGAVYLVSVDNTGSKGKYSSGAYAFPYETPLGAKSIEWNGSITYNASFGADQTLQANNAYQLRLVPSENTAVEEAGSNNYNGTTLPLAFLSCGAGTGAALFQVSLVTSAGVAVAFNWSTALGMQNKSTVALPGILNVHIQPTNALTFKTVRLTAYVGMDSDELYIALRKYKWVLEQVH